MLYEAKVLKGAAESRKSSSSSNTCGNRSREGCNSRETSEIYRDQEPKPAAVRHSRKGEKTIIFPVRYEMIALYFSENVLHFKNHRKSGPGVQKVAPVLQSFGNKKGRKRDSITCHILYTCLALAVK